MKQKTTLAVSDPVFRQVYESRASLPGRHKWLTRDVDVCKIEALLRHAAQNHRRAADERPYK